MVTLNRLVAINATPETLEPTIDRRVRYGTVRYVSQLGNEGDGVSRAFTRSGNKYHDQYVYLQANAAM